MALSCLSTKITSSSSSASFLLRLRHSFSCRSRFTIGPFAPRFIHTNFEGVKEKEVIVPKGGLPFESEEDEEAVYARYEMPGIGKEGLKLWVEKNMIHIEGEEMDRDPNWHKGTENPKKYKMSVEMPPEEFKMDQVRALLNNGMLRLVIPKLHPGRKDDGFQFDFRVCIPLPPKTN